MDNLWALHGFLGKESDWKICKELATHMTINTVDLFQSNLPKPSKGLWCWAEEFNNLIHTKENILLGYSLGGRLALHTILQKPQIWKGAVIISAHTGLTSDAAKLEKLKADREWAMRFENEPWEHLMRAWNSQSIFADSNALVRIENEQNRAHLAAACSGWSLGIQEDLQTRLQEINLPILWVTGKNDTKYSALANVLHFKHHKSRMVMIQNVGHRVPWDNSERFREEVIAFQEQL